ncbi:GNAT family N-acetyltransferase [Hamadaea tsunoensis]|uniref:GNAT family N-acetyltransferase n=1 Tax=Hamadaea tsunoensis TaxID=53368 RepID=UPI00047F941A|nr:GNAT family N-acetyltransferase [Hamadaea tsunoensis]
MGELDLATVAAANEAWVLEPEGSEVVETAEYRLVRYPDQFSDPLNLQWVRTSRPARDVLIDIVDRAARFGLPEVQVYVRLSAPDGFDDALLDRGAELVDTADVLALRVPADVTTPDVPGLDLRWRTELDVARDASTVARTVFGGGGTPDEKVLARRAAADRETVAAGTGGLVVAYLEGTPVAVAGIKIVDGVARLWGGAVLEEYRGRGVYRAMVAARLAYAAGHGATMALTQGRVATSSPILRRLGFLSFGQERTYSLPLV